MLSSRLDDMVSHFRRMLLMRKFDENVDALYGEGKIAGTTHLYIGQEAIASGVCAHLTDGDVITSTHRGHGHSLATGGDIHAMYAEILGRSTGCCGGYGGSMHVADPSKGNLGANGIVGAGVPIATGAALHFKRSGSKRTAVAFMGDGALNEGCVHEALNLAAIWALPAIFVIENNGYGLSSHVSKMYAIKDLAERAVAYGMASEIVDGQDVLAVDAAARRAFDRARSGGGPTLLEMKTYRFRGHSKNDPGRYRTRDEIARWRARDPIVLIASRLKERGYDPARLKDIEADIERSVTAAIGQAEQDPLPEPGDISRNVYRGSGSDSEADNDEAGPTQAMSYSEAIRWAIGDTLRENASSFLIGEDVGAYGGSFGVTRGLFDLFGGERIYDAPISEAAIVGVGVGAAMVGGRPIVEIQFSDFLTNAMDAIVNQAAKVHFMSGGKMNVPLVIRTPMGGGVGMGAQHSQSLEAWFYHVPGLKVVAPSTGDDARGLLLSAIEDGNPVIFLEHKKLYAKRGPVSQSRQKIPFGKAVVRRAGADATVVTYSAMVEAALTAADALESKHGYRIEVIDLRTLVPLDWETVEASIEKTGRLAICHEAVVRGGVGGDIAAGVCSGPLFARLRSPILRIGAPETPVPFSPVLETHHLPDSESVFRGLLRWLEANES